MTTAATVFGLPLSDWQFYAVTVLAAAGGWLAVRPFFARRGRPGTGGCSSCTFGTGISAGAAPKSEAPSNLVSIGRRPR